MDWKGNNINVDSFDLVNDKLIDKFIVYVQELISKNIAQSIYKRHRTIIQLSPGLGT